jgi:integrase/recombinase XerD
LLTSNIKTLKLIVLNTLGEKLKDSENTESVIQVPLTEEISSIIVELGNEDKRPNSYVFNVINDKMDLDKQDRVIRQKIGLTNKWLKVLCEANDLPAITTYWARHSYASMLKDLNISVEMIRELLDHSDIRTTEAYLKRFDLGEKKKANDKIYANLKVS